MIFKLWKQLSYINIDDDFEIIGVINNEILCIQKQSNLLFIDLKYFEIIFIKEIEEGFNHIKIVDNYLLQFYGKENKLKIKKDFFNLKHRQFEKEELLERNIKVSYLTEILSTDKGYFVISNFDELFIFKLWY